MARRLCVALVLMVSVSELCTVPAYAEADEISAPKRCVAALKVAGELAFEVTVVQQSASRTKLYPPKQIGSAKVVMAPGQLRMELFPMDRTDHPVLVYLVNDGRVTEWLCTGRTKTYDLDPEAGADIVLGDEVESLKESGHLQVCPFGALLRSWVGHEGKPPAWLVRVADAADSGRTAKVGDQNCTMHWANRINDYRSGTDWLYFEEGGDEMVRRLQYTVFFGENGGPAKTFTRTSDYQYVKPHITPATFTTLPEPWAVAPTSQPFEETEEAGARREPLLDVEHDGA